MTEAFSDPAGRVITLVASTVDAGERLDRFLARRCQELDGETAAGLSRARLQALIKAGCVLADDRPVETGNLKVKAGQAFSIRLGPAAPAEPVAQSMPLAIVHEDRDLIVIDKPAGLVVHPGAGHADGTLVNALIAHCGDSLSGIGGVKRPGIVHRLDKDTSGLLVVAKNDAAHQSLSEQFQAHGADGRLVRRYLAVVWGTPHRQKGSVDAPLARSASNRTKIGVSRREDARHAVTHYRLIKAFAEASLLELTLETGRTHQIRVHMAHLGHPILGDATYGTSHKTRAVKLPPAARDALTALNRQALHAAVLGFAHPRTGKALLFESKPPADLQALLDALG